VTCSPFGGYAGITADVNVGINVYSKVYSKGPLIDHTCYSKADCDCNHRIIG
jgi:hypothetical protein